MQNNNNLDNQIIKISMNMTRLTTTIFIICVFTMLLKAQVLPFSKVKISVASELRASFVNGGRLFLHITKQTEREPRFHSEITFAITPQNWEASTTFMLNKKNKTIRTQGLDKWNPKTAEKYYFQVVYKQNLDDGQENVAGNIYSTTDSTVLSSKSELNISINKLIMPSEIIQHKFVKSVRIKSELLSTFSGHPRFLKASILLPSTFFENPDKSYPICYRAPGLNGRYDGINGIVKNNNFIEWWFSKSAPQVIYVFLDSQGPYGDTYQVDSENNGPCGKALTEELIPEIEKLVHYDPNSKMRFVTGYSTGGWVSLGLQILYPDFFDGTWSYSPDPVEFEHYGLINIYQDSTIFYNKYGYLQPGKRTTFGEPTRSMKDWITSENFASRTDSYLVSGGQFGAYNAVFGPKGNDGLPSLMFDPLTGKIDHAITKQWEKYDLKKVLEKNWVILGPKLQGKIWIWTGDMDGLYSNVATRFFKTFLDKTENPKSDAKISFTPMAGHTQEWNDKAVLTMIGEKTKNFQSNLFFSKKSPAQKILFIGNSLTYRQNGIYFHLEKLANPAQNIQTTKSVKGGATLKTLWEWKEPQDSIAQTTCDVVVLQEDLPEINVSYFRTYAQKFVEEIRKAKLRPILLMAWPYERLGWINTKEIADAHRSLAKELGVEVAPVALAWEQAQKERLDLNLFVADKEHPSIYGTYLASNVIYATIFRKSPVDLSYVPEGISLIDAAFLRRVAWETVQNWEK